MAPYPAGPAPERRPPPLRFDSIAQCGTCGLGVAQPRASQPALDAFYASGAYWHASGGSRAQRAHERNQGHHRVLRCLPHFKEDGPVADIGAGHGAIAEWLNLLASDRVLRYDFVEPDAANRQWILSRGTRFPIADVATIADLGRDYALVFLDHVLEHVADPVEFLGSVCERLRPRGIAYIETPHADHRFKDDVFPHTLFFTPYAFEHLAARLGLELVECTAFGAYPGAAGGISLRVFRWLDAAFHAAARAGLASFERRLDDAIWRYRPAPDGMWLRCVLRRPA